MSCVNSCLYVITSLMGYHIYSGLSCVFEMWLGSVRKTDAIPVIIPTKSKLLYAIII